MTVKGSVFSWDLSWLRRYISAKILGNGNGLAAGACAILFALSSSFVAKQSGHHSGSVFDQSGGAIAGAVVTVIDVARGVTRNLIADGAGQYVATDLNSWHLYRPRGGQRLPDRGAQRRAGRGGSKHSRRHGVQPGEQTQTVTVTGEVPAIDTTDATLGGTVSN